MLTFELRVSVSATSAAAIKRELANSFPGMKSTHLSEAVARGIGFRTHASFLTATKSGGRQTSTISGTEFLTFLGERGYAADEKSLYIAAARVAIRNVMDTHPRLSHWGLGIGPPKTKPDGKLENAKEHYSRFLGERDQLLCDAQVEEFLRGLVLVQVLAPIKTINLRSGSYGLKHRAENLTCNYPGGTILGPAYVANGTLIAAALHEGFTCKTFLDHLGYDDVNVAFNMSQISLDDVAYRFLGSRGLTEKGEQHASRRRIRKHDAVIQD